jgi:hypothetical protein
MNASQIAAFKQAVGGPAGGYVPGDFALVFALIAGAVAVLWAAHMIRVLGTEALGGRLKFARAAAYKLRVIVLLLLLIYALH